MKQSQKDIIYKLICDNKFSIFNRKNKEELFIRFLEKNNIILSINNINISNVIAFLKNVDTKCKIDGCVNNRIFLGIRLDNRTEHGFRKYCSTECENKGISLRQMGDNNSFNKISDESYRSMREKCSIRMKNDIKTGKFTPNITNSWHGSLSYLNIDNKVIKYRSSWEAFFHLCNTKLEYEKLRIEYEYNGEKHIYIVDFIDYNDNILYEIKPNSLRNNDIVKVKEKYCLEWCEKNGYELIFISDEWYINNFTKYKHLLNNQEDGKNIIKKLKQFDEN